MKENNIHKMIRRNVDRQLVREYLLKETERAGFGGLTFNRTPEGTKVTLQAEQVGRVIGRRGKVIHDLQRRLQEDFDLDNPQLEVEEIEESRTNAQVMASRLASSLGRGLTEECQKLVERVRNSNGKTVKTHCRGMYVLPEMVGSTIGVHDGQKFVNLEIIPPMIGHSLGEFAKTRTVSYTHLTLPTTPYV